MRLHLVTAAVAGSITLSAFLLGCSTTVTATITPPADCASDSSLVCTQGTGITCPSGVDPQVENPSFSCSIPVSDSAGDHYCCFTWSGGTTCTPDETLVCPDPSSFGYVCAGGDNPENFDSSLNCSAPVQDGANDDFCCR